jgi:apoptosis-inducing factor 2
MENHQIFLEPVICCKKTVNLLMPTSVNVQEIKEGYLAQKHALLVAKNLKLLIKGSPVNKLTTYSTGFPLTIVSLGRNEGIAHLPFVTLSGCLPGRVKSRDLFVSKTRKKMGLNS